MTGSVILGIICGLAGALPPAYLFEVALKSNRANMAQGFVSLAASFVMLLTALMVVYVTIPATLISFTFALVITFLGFWTVMALRALKQAKLASQALVQGKE